MNALFAETLVGEFGMWLVVGMLVVATVWWRWRKRVRVIPAPVSLSEVHTEALKAVQVVNPRNLRRADGGVIDGEADDANGQKPVRISFYTMRDGTLKVQVYSYTKGEFLREAVVWPAVVK